MKTIMLIDMDAFFASVEQQCNPALRGKPISVVGADHRTVITASSYEAKARGVKTGMNKYEAKRICPDLIFVVGDHRKYTHTCKELSIIYSKYTPDVEVYSVDEAFLDITGTAHLFGGPIAVAMLIKRDIREKFGINASIGISYNKLMAKLASDISKPNGLRMVTPEMASALLEDMPTDELWGIGRATAMKLQAMGIRTCGELGRASAGLLRSHFGIIGERLKAMGQGIYISEVSPVQEEARSVGHSMTLPSDITDMGLIDAYILKLSEMVGRRARRYNLAGSVISVVVRYKSFSTFSRQGRLRRHTNDTHAIYSRAMKIIRSIKLREAVRLLGVSISDLIEDPHEQYIFKDLQRRRSLLESIDRINDRYGEFTISWASYADLRRHAGVISPAWRPSGLRRTL